MTRALDTNVLVRILADRQSPQAALAERMLESAFAISTSVFLETEWVLRSVFGWKRNQIGAAFRDLLDLPALAVAPPAIDWIIERYEAGADFADMVHLCTADGASAFATFDADLASKAGSSSPITIETLT